MVARTPVNDAKSSDQYAIFISLFKDLPIRLLLLAEKL